VAMSGLPPSRRWKARIEGAASIGIKGVDAIGAAASGAIQGAGNVGRAATDTTSNVVRGLVQGASERWVGL
jgi:hypothetical protein